MGDGVDLVAMEDDESRRESGGVGGDCFGSLSEKLDRDELPPSLDMHDEEEDGEMRDRSGRLGRVKVL